MIHLFSRIFSIQDNIPYITTTTLCNQPTLSAENGLIQSPNYPNKVSNTNCTIKYNSDVKQIFSVYAISIELESSLLIQGYL